LQLLERRRADEWIKPLVGFGTPFGTGELGLPEREAQCACAHVWGATKRLVPVTRESLPPKRLAR
jgi:hypothetical protein